MAKKTENATETKTSRLHIFGLLTYVSRGIDTKFDPNNKTEKSTLSLKPSEAEYPELAQAFKDSGKKFTPAFIKGESEYLTLKSQYDIPLYANGKLLCEDVYMAIEKKLPIKDAEVEVIVKCGDGAVYPLGLNIRKWGTVLTTGVTADDFESCEVDEVEIPFE